MRGRLMCLQALQSVGVALGGFQIEFRACQTALNVGDVGGPASSVHHTLLSLRFLHACAGSRDVGRHLAAVQLNKRISRPHVLAAMDKDLLDNSCTSGARCRPLDGLHFAVRWNGADDGLPRSSGEWHLRRRGLAGNTPGDDKRQHDDAEDKNHGAAAQFHCRFLAHESKSNCHSAS